MERSAQAAPERRRLRWSRPPAGLAALIAIVVIVGAAWALTVPPWQSPDEVAHFGYVRSVGETFTLPGRQGLPEVSSDQSVADNAVGASRGAFFPVAVPPDWSRADWRSYLAAVRAHPPSRANGTGPNPASANPPLYYLLADVPYEADRSGSTFGQLYAIRIWGVLLLAATAIAGWLLAGEVLGRRRLPQLACAAVVGLLPMQTFITTSVNPDALMIALWTFALWLGARVINRGAEFRDAIALSAVTAAAILTKATSYALVVPVLVALLVGWRRRGSGRAVSRWRVAAVALALIAPVLAWLGLAHALGRSAINTIATGPGAHPFNVSQFLSYLWQYYLPRLPFQTPLRTTPQLPAYDIWLKQGIGVFGWLDVGLPSWMYRVGAVLLAAIGVAAAVTLARWLRGARQFALLGFLGLALIALLGLLHITEYRSLIAGQGPILQGRYLLPVVGLLGLCVGLIVLRLPLRWRAPAGSVVLAAMLGLQAISLAAVLQAYYL